MPALGANTRLTQSMPGRSPAAVTMTQRDLQRGHGGEVGTHGPDRVGAGQLHQDVGAATGVGAHRRRASGPASDPATRPSVAAIDGGAASATGGSAGKSISIQPSPPGVHTNAPLLVWNVPAPPSTWAAARVAWPHRSTSTVGREPAQVVGPVGAGHDERRLRQVHLAGDGLHAGFVGKGVHHGDRRGVAGEGSVGEGVDDGEVQWVTILASGTHPEGGGPRRVR